MDCCEIERVAEGLVRAERRRKAAEGLLAELGAKRPFEECGLYEICAKDAESGDAVRRLYYAGNEVQALNLMLLDMELQGALWLLEGPVDCIRKGKNAEGGKGKGEEGGGRRRATCMTAEQLDRVWEFVGLAGKHRLLGGGGRYVPTLTQERALESLAEAAEGLCGRDCLAKVGELLRKVRDAGRVAGYVEAATREELCAVAAAADAVSERIENEDENENGASRVSRRDTRGGEGAGRRMDVKGGAAGTPWKGLQDGI